MQGSTGRTLCTVGGDNVMDLNRTTSNGVILGFYLNGSSVGTVSTNSNIYLNRNFKRYKRFKFRFKFIKQIKTKSIQLHS